jgi:hypothetical protein
VQCRVQLRAVDRRGDLVQGIQRHCRFGQRRRERGVEPVIVEPVGDRFLALRLLERRAHAA